MSESVRPTDTGFSWLPFLVVGVVICLLLEAAFYLELAVRGPLMLIFLWAYSQAALVALVVPSAGPPSWVYQYIAWLLFYVTVAFGLWALLGRSHRLPRATAWRRALAGWVVVELLLGIVSAGALSSGIIQME